eukprot:TRINITY_DN16670_c0_g2_i4.p1 TRINITY_DN16670_c0_g2~~TRINITY_DN16670_c0_g2_i4.p1  ORF type:complete len:113 (+),score=46.40 TRINITY_DN16670_c0_g2_i4:277-615(+)
MFNDANNAAMKTKEDYDQMQTALNDIIKTVDECCEKTLKMIDKAPTEGKKETRKDADDLFNKSLESASKEKFNKVQRVHDLLNEDEFEKVGAVNVSEIKPEFGDISGIKEEN